MGVMGLAGVKTSLAIFMAAAVLSGWNAKAAPVNVIFDTDMCGDCDDVGALAVLNKMADVGEELDALLMAPPKGR